MSAGEVKDTVLSFDRYEFSLRERLLTRNGEVVHLTPRVFDLLAVLVDRSGHVVTKEELLERVWSDAAVEEGNINRTVSTLRKHLGRQVNGNDFIETVPKSGYRFLAPVSVEPSGEVGAKKETSSAELPIGSRAQRLFAALLVFVLLLAGFILWRRIRQPSVESVEAKVTAGPVRLTNTGENEQVAGWTSDGRILLTRWTASNKPESFVVNADGGRLEKAALPADIRQAVVSPDGKRMLAWRYSDGGSSAYLSAADGSASKRLPYDIENPAWSPDSSILAFQMTSNGVSKLASTEVAVYSVGDNKLTELTSNLSFDGDPGWSPDGQSLVFSSDRDGNHEIYSMRSDGSSVRRLTNNPGHDSFPKYSPDGTQIAFNSNFERETTDVYVMNTDGSNLVRITDSKGNDLSRNGWSPDGTKFAYNSDIDGNDEIYLTDIEPSRPELLIGSNDADLQTPSYSPDGRKIVYSAEMPDKHAELWIYDVVSGASTTLVQTSSPMNYPAWSPDGQWIAFHQEVNGKWDVLKIRPDGTGLVNLTNHASSDSIPSWSPDSATIYFRSNRNGDTERSQIFKMNADGSGQTALPVALGKLGWGRISPKGSDIVFACDRSDDPEKMFDIFVADVETGKEHAISSRTGNEVQPVFSYDGTLMAFVSASDGNQEIYIAGSDGSEPRRLTRNRGSDAFPAFSPVERSLIFSSNRSGKTAIYRVLY